MEISWNFVSPEMWEPKYYWKYTWNFLEKTWKYHGILSVQKCGNPGIWIVTNFTSSVHYIFLKMKMQVKSTAGEIRTSAL